MRLQRLAEDVAQRCARIGRTVLLDGLLLFGELTGLDREVGLFRTVEPGNHGVELLADLEAVGALFVAVAAKVGALDEAGRAIVASLHFKAAIAHFEHGDGDDLAFLSPRCPSRLQRRRRRSALFKLLHAERDALLLDIDVEHDGRDLLALAVQRQRVLARDAPGDVRHVDHAIDVAVEADEQAEFGGVLDFAFDLAADRVLVGERPPTGSGGPA